MVQHEQEDVFLRAETPQHGAGGRAVLQVERRLGLGEQAAVQFIRIPADSVAHFQGHL